MGALKIILSLIISGLIGYLTNYIAVKMLFRPRKAVYIGKNRLPFTPGIIPRNQPRLAKALGNAVGEQLFTSNDLTEQLTSDSTAQAVGNAAAEAIFSDKTLKEAAVSISSESLSDVEQQIEELICDTAARHLHGADISGIIIEEGSQALKEKTEGTMLAMFVTDDLIQSFAQPIAEKIDQYIDTKGYDFIRSAVSQELSKLGELSAADILEALNVSRASVAVAAADIYKSFAAEKLSDIVKSLDIPSAVEKRVNEMDVAQVEELVMSVMKNELNAVIDLGALIGVIIGLLNVLVQNIS